MPQIVIVDTNILFSVLVSGPSEIGAVLLESQHHFFVCEQVLVELFRHKEKITKASRLSEGDLMDMYRLLLRRVNIFKEDSISKRNWMAAYHLCQDVDESDTPHVALTLELDGVLWTGDKKLRDGLNRKGFNRFFSGVG